MMERLITNTAILLVIALTGCYYDNEETLYPGDCITTDISYVQDIAPIIQQNCYGCHSAALNTGNVTLEGHAKLAGYALNGRLLGAIRHDPGFIAMPEGAAQLSDCNIAKIEQWATDGALNN